MKELPNTNKITKAFAGEPRNYTELQIKKIAETLGPLPNGKVVYQGHYAAFSIFGEEIPELEGKWHHYMHNTSLQKRQITRELALRCHLEAAAYVYKREKAPQKKWTPLQSRKALRRLEKTCHALVKELKSFEFIPYGIDAKLDSPIPDLLHEATRLIPTLTRLGNETGKHVENCPAQTTPPKSRHQKNHALHNLIFSLCHAWEYIAGKKVNAGTFNAKGQSGGPIIRFIQSAISPLEIKVSPHSIRQILRKYKVKSKI
jgi:hypothetical protein